jgi:hypothetical protein
LNDHRLCFYHERRRIEEGLIERKREGYVRVEREGREFLVSNPRKRKRRENEDILGHKSNKYPFMQNYQNTPTLSVTYPTLIIIT